MVFFEGIEGVGKTSLCAALAGWRADTFSLFDRGPWSRWVYARHFGYSSGVAQTESLVQRIRPYAIAVHVHRPFEHVQGCRPSLARDAAEAQEALFEQAWRLLPPQHVLHLHNDGEQVEQVAAALRERLSALVPPAAHD